MEEKAISYGTEDNEGVDPHLWMTFAEYLINIGSTLLGSHPNNHTGSSPTRHNPLVTGFKFCLETQEGVEIVQRFLNSGECSVLLVELMQDNRGRVMYISQMVSFKVFYIPFIFFYL